MEKYHISYTPASNEIKLLFQELPEVGFFYTEHLMEYIYRLKSSVVQCVYLPGKLCL